MGGFTLHFGPNDQIKISVTVWNAYMTSPALSEVRWQMVPDSKSSCTEGSVAKVGLCPTDEKHASLIVRGRVLMRLWFARDIWRYRNVFWLIDWLIDDVCYLNEKFEVTPVTAVCHVDSLVQSKSVDATSTSTGCTNGLSRNSAPSLFRRFQRNRLQVPQCFTPCW